MTSRRRVAERAYRIAMLVLPGPFRERFGDEMVEFARGRLRAARSRGRRAVVREGMALAMDVVRTAPREWLDERRVIPTPPPREDMDILMHDLKFGVRGLLRRPGFTAVAA